VLADNQERDRRRRARNWAMLIVLLGLAVLFFAITLVRLRHF
jgi:hypothetical protein